jgi:hypothetical protein
LGFERERLYVRQATASLESRLGGVAVRQRLALLTAGSVVSWRVSRECGQTVNEAFLDLEKASRPFL